MNHLSSEQISQWVIENRAPDAERHAQECAACRKEIERVQGSLTLFRDSVRQLSDARFGVESRAAWTPPGAWSRYRLRWAATAATIALLGAFPAYRSWDNSRRIATAKQDAVLLEQVDAELSRSVPQPLETWSNLMLSGPSSSKTHSGGNGSSEKGSSQ